MRPLSKQTFDHLAIQFHILMSGNWSSIISNIALDSRSFVLGNLFITPTIILLLPDKSSFILYGKSLMIYIAAPPLVKRFLLLCMNLYTGI